jgi:hypothetical protein
LNFTGTVATAVFCGSVHFFPATEIVESADIFESLSEIDSVGFHETAANATVARPASLWFAPSEGNPSVLLFPTGDLPSGQLARTGPPRYSAAFSGSPALSASNAFVTLAFGSGELRPSGAPAPSPIVARSDSRTQSGHLFASPGATASAAIARSARLSASDVFGDTPPIVPIAVPGGNTDGTSLSPTWIAIAAAGGALLLIALIVAIIVLRRREETEPGQQTQTQTAPSSFDETEGELECENPLDLEGLTHIDMEEIWQEDPREML